MEGDAVQIPRALAHPRMVAALALAPLSRRPGALWARRALLWAAVTAAALGATLAVLLVTLHPSAGHAAQMVLALAIGGGVSIGLGVAALWLARFAGAGGVRTRLAFPPLLTALVIAFNVALIARMMFITPEDSQLLFAFLAFGVCVALLLAASLAAHMTRAIVAIETGARRIAAGDYAYRLDERNAAGVRELARLAGWFNAMAASVQEAFERQRAAESERRHVIAAVSHDLRTPLAAVRAMIEAIDDGVVSDAETVRRYQRTIRAEVRHLSGLMDDLFELARLEAGATGQVREVMPVEDLISDAIEATRRQADRAGVCLDGRIDGALPPVAIDARQIHRVLANLLQNAVRHTPAGGAIRIQAETSAAGDGRREVRIHVVDTGEGIAAADLPHVFARSYRGEASRRRSGADAAEADDPAALSSGAGLGLAIARGIVEAHGGRIWAESPPPAVLWSASSSAAMESLPGAARTVRQGTVISFTLPVARTSPRS
jgi:two-component system, OmpR family, sensor histidine kinase SaeS